MSRKIIIVLAITTLFTAVVVASSWIYLDHLLQQRMQALDEEARWLAQQLAHTAANAVPDLTSTRIDTGNPKVFRAAILDFLERDTNLSDMIQSVVGDTQIFTDAAIVDANGIVILNYNATLKGKQLPARPDLNVLKYARFRRQLRMLYGPVTRYDVGQQLELDGQPFGGVRVTVSTVLLRNEMTPRLQQAMFFSILAVVCSLVLGAVVSNFALGPLKQIARNLDDASAGATEAINDESSSDEVGLVSLKIAHLGRQIRDNNQIFSALKDNVEQVMSKLQDGLMLFTRDSRAVLVSASAEKFLGRPRGEILGRTAEEIFSDGSALGAVMRPAFQQRRSLVQYEFDADENRRVQVSLDFIQEKGAAIGALLTMRDVESVRRIEDEIEISRRLSASGHVTRNVAHEVKNPINAIVLHLQLLQDKLREADPDTRRHMDVIGSEIHRLDRVVQILVDFTRPQDLRLEEVDMRRILEEVAILAAPDAAGHGVQVVRDLPGAPLMVRADSDMLKQAVLNLVLNGVQAMSQGGTLTLTSRRNGEEVLTEIRDQGSGIPADLHDKVFELYFTTKKGGSGIGLAQTYQIMQWHYGAVEFESAAGVGTTFRLRLPAVAPDFSTRAEQAAN